MATQKEKTERALYGPSIIEVVFGAALSIVLGAVLAVVLLVLKPVQLVNEMPKEPESDVLYFINGTKDANRSRQAQAKRQMFVRGQSVSLNEDELNVLLASAAPAAPAAPVAPKAGAKKDEPAPAAPSGFLTASAPNFKITDGKMQIAIPCTLSLVGVSLPVTVVAVGGFEKSGDIFVFTPEDLHLGSLAANRMPSLPGMIRGKIVDSQKVPDDLAAAWKKVSAVTIEGKNLNIAM